MIIFLIVIIFTYHNENKGFYFFIGEVKVILVDGIIIYLVMPVLTGSFCVVYLYMLIRFNIKIILVP